MKATTEEVIQILAEARKRVEALDAEHRSAYTLKAMASTHETIALCKARLESEGVSA